ncbi:MAG: tetraacyldisaccharide 4'-kinase [Desulfobacterales bacterium]
MISIKKKIERVITGDNKNGYGWFVPFLSMASKVYGGAVKLRRIFYKKAVLKSKRLPCPIISIGNITVGGTGKTPMTIYVAQVVKQLGYKVAIISRGYKGKAEKGGGIVSDGKMLLMTPEIAGDEPYMMANRLKDVPVIVGKNRFKAGWLAIRKFDPDVIVLDDGFQHLKLQRDLDLVLLDYRKPFGNGHLLPRGVMREPASALLCANAIILTRSDTVNDNETSSSPKKLRPYERKKPVYRTFHHPFVYKIINGEKKIFEKNMQAALRQNSDCIKGRTVFAFSGLADNHNFRQTVKSLKCNVSGYMEFPDHHSYSDRDLKDISAAAKRSMSECLITTEKDYVRIAHKIDWPGDLFVIGIEIDFGADKKRFNSYIKDWIKNWYESD